MSTLGDIILCAVMIAYALISMITTCQQNNELAERLTEDVRRKHRKEPDT